MSEVSLYHVRAQRLETEQVHPAEPVPVSTYGGSFQTLEDLKGNEAAPGA